MELCAVMLKFEKPVELLPVTVTVTVSSGRR
jgi:hypothetical protein